MVEDAAAHEEDDRKRREQVEARNKADQLAYGVEKALEEVKDKLPADKVADVEGKVKSLREAIEANDTAAIASQSEALEAAMKEIAEVAYSSAAAGATDGAPDGAAPEASADEPSKGDDDVIDAEFEEGG
jgi:molecular chaperone DnaK